MNNQTTTSVQNEKTMLRQRTDAFLRDQYALSGVSIYTQLLIGISMYLFGHVSTPGYLSILLSGVGLFLIFFLSAFLQKKADPEKGPLRTFLGGFPGKAAAVLLALCFLLDGQLASFTLCAIVAEILPDVSILWGALAMALLTACAIGGRDEYALPRLSRVLRWVLVLFMAWPVIAALPQGNFGHLFPIFGQGVGNIASGGLWMCGCVAGACCPWLLPQNKKTANQLSESRPSGFASLLGGLVFALLFALCSAYLLPFHALARPETLGWRMLIFSTLSPSLIGWSLMLWAILFFLLFALSAGVTRAASLIAWTAGKKAASPMLITVLLLLQIPLSAMNTDAVEQALAAAAPWRAAGVALVLASCLIGYAVQHGKRAGEKA